MKRQAKPGEFRSNLHRGGTASLIKITPEERMTAIRAAKVMAVGGRRRHPALQPRPVVMEVNSSPGLEGIEVDHRQGRCRDDHRLPGKERRPQPDTHQG